MSTSGGSDLRLNTGLWEGELVDCGLHAQLIGKVMVCFRLSLSLVVQQGPQHQPEFQTSADCPMLITQQGCCGLTQTTVVV